MGSDRVRTIAALIAAALIVVVVLFVAGGAGSGGASASPSTSASASVTAAESPSAAPSATSAAVSPSSTVAASATLGPTAPPATAAPASPSHPPATAAPPSPSHALATALPSATSPPLPSATISGRDLSGTWKGSWTNVTPDQATGILEVTWVQTGSALDGNIVFDSPCSNASGVQGTVTGPGVEFSTVGRDKAVFRGVVTGTRINGTFTSSCDISTGTFELTKAP